VADCVSCAWTRRARRPAQHGQRFVRTSDKTIPQALDSSGFPNVSRVRIYSTEDRKWVVLVAMIVAVMVLAIMIFIVLVMLMSMLLLPMPMPMLLLLFLMLLLLLIVLSLLLPSASFRMTRRPIQAQSEDTYRS
jgi:hypothetical protein